MESRARRSQDLIPAKHAIGVQNPAPALLILALRVPAYSHQQIVYRCLHLWLTVLEHRLPSAPLASRIPTLPALKQSVPASGDHHQQLRRVGALEHSKTQPTDSCAASVKPV